MPLKFNPELTLSKSWPVTNTVTPASVVFEGDTREIVDAFVKKNYHVIEQ